MPCGMVEEERVPLRLTLGSACQPSAGLVEASEAWWAA
jgi:hypothetical protein